MVLLNGYRPLNFTGKHLVSFVGPFANKGRQEVDIGNEWPSLSVFPTHFKMVDFSTSTVALLTEKCTFLNVVVLIISKSRVGNPVISCNLSSTSNFHFRGKQGEEEFQDEARVVGKFKVKSFYA